MPEGRAGRRKAVVRPGPEAVPGAPWGGWAREARRPEGQSKAERSPTLTDNGDRREGRGDGSGRRRTKPAGSDAAARPRRLQRLPHTEHISGTKKRQTVNRKAEDMRPGNKTPREGKPRAVPRPGAEERDGDALARVRKERCRRRDRAGAEECPGAPPAYLLMGWRAGIPPGGRQGGDGKAARDVTARPYGRRGPCLP